MSEQFITVQTIVHASCNKVWDLWTLPEHIVNWNHATDEWCCPRAETDLKVGGRYTFRMEARDGSMGFDMSGTYLKINHPTFLSYDMDDGRIIHVSINETNDGTEVIERFEPDDSHSREQQEKGWKAILNNFKKYVENHEH